MKNQSQIYKPFYRRNLPHLQPKGGTFFVTYRLADSIPLNLLNEIRRKHEVTLLALKKDLSKNNDQVIQDLRFKFFLQYDELLDKMLAGPTFLKIPEIAHLIQKNLKRFDGEFYDLIAYCIMPNHVHVLLDTSIQFPKIWTVKDIESLNVTSLMQIMKRIKGPTAVEANRCLNRTGQFWNRESYDRLIRDERELDNTIAYILENPVKAGMANDWEAWPFSFYKYL